MCRSESYCQNLHFCRVDMCSPPKYTNAYTHVTLIAVIERQWIGSRVAAGYRGWSELIRTATQTEGIQLGFVTLQQHPCTGQEVKLREMKWRMKSRGALGEGKEMNLRGRRKLGAEGRNWGKKRSGEVAVGGRNERRESGGRQRRKKNTKTRRQDKSKKREQIKKTAIWRGKFATHIFRTFQMLTRNWWIKICKMVLR